MVVDCLTMMSIYGRGGWVGDIERFADVEGGGEVDEEGKEGGRRCKTFSGDVGINSRNPIL